MAPSASRSTRAWVSPPTAKRKRTAILEPDCTVSHQVPGLEAALAAVRDLPPARYTEDDWQIVRACFTLLRHAAGRIAESSLPKPARSTSLKSRRSPCASCKGEDGLPTDAALAVADGIRHLLVDEFQDTSRRQHQLLACLIAAWPEPTGRTCFVVGDPMQSIYFFRDADAELFPRVKTVGLEIPDSRTASLRLRSAHRQLPHRSQLWSTSSMRFLLKSLR